MILLLFGLVILGIVLFEMMAPGKIDEKDGFKKTALDRKLEKLGFVGRQWKNTNGRANYGEAPPAAKTPPSTPEPLVSKTLLPSLEPLNSDLIRKLQEVKGRISVIESKTNKVQKSVSNINRWIWAIPIGFLIGLYWDSIVSFISKYLFLRLFVLIEVLFWVSVAFGIGYIIWAVVRFRKTLEIPTLANTVTQEPFNNEIMRELNRIEESVKSIEVKTTKVENSIGNINLCGWWIPIGFLIGLYLDDVLSSLF